MRTIKALLIGVPIVLLFLVVVYGLFVLFTYSATAPYVVIGIIILIVGFMLGTVALDLIEEHKKAKADELDQ